MCLAEPISRDDFSSRLELALGGRPFTASSWDDVDRLYLLERVTDGGAGVAVTRFQFEIPVPRLEIDTGSRRVGEERVILRNLFAKCTLTLLDARWASLVITVPIASGLQRSRDFRAALAHDRGGARLPGLSADQLIGLTQVLSSADPANTVAREVLGEGIYADLGLECVSSDSAHAGLMTLIWGLDGAVLQVPSAPMTAIAVLESIPAIIAGITSRDEHWADRSPDQLDESLGQRVGSGQMVATVSGDHLVVLTPGDEERRRNEITEHGTYPGQLRALEYALYQNAIVAAAEDRVATIELSAEEVMSNSGVLVDTQRTNTLLHLLQQVWRTHAGVLLGCEAKYKPWIFKHGFEQDVVDAILDQSGTNDLLASIRGRLEALNTLADEAHSIAAGQQLAAQQARLLEIQNTTLVSQLELKALTQSLAQLTSDAQDGAKSLGWINALVAISAALALLSLIATREGSTAAFGDQVRWFLSEIGPIAGALVLGTAVLFLFSVLVTLAVTWAYPRLRRRRANASVGRSGVSPHPGTDVDPLEVHRSLKKSKFVSALVDEFEAGYTQVAPGRPQLERPGDGEDLDDFLARWHEEVMAFDARCTELFERIKKASSRGA